MALRPFVLYPRRSRHALLGLSALAALGAFLLWRYALPGWLGVLLALSWLAALRAEGWLPGARRVDAVLVDARGVLSVRQNGRLIEMQLGPASMASRWLCIVAGRAGGSALRLVLWPDSADADALRRLRVFLVWQRADHTVDDKHADTDT